jgi:hypothetical protein
MSPRNRLLSSVATFAPSLRGCEWPIARVGRRFKGTQVFRRQLTGRSPPACIRALVCTENADSTIWLEVIWKRRVPPFIRTSGTRWKNQGCGHQSGNQQLPSRVSCHRHRRWGRALDPDAGMHLRNRQSQSVHRGSPGHHGAETD